MKRVSHRWRNVRVPGRRNRILTHSAQPMAPPFIPSHARRTMRGPACPGFSAALLSFLGEYGVRISVYGAGCQVAPLLYADRDNLTAARRKAGSRSSTSLMETLPSSGDRSVPGTGSHPENRWGGNKPGRDGAAKLVGGSGWSQRIRGGGVGSAAGRREPLMRTGPPGEIQRSRGFTCREGDLVFPRYSEGSTSWPDSLPSAFPRSS